MKSYRIFLASTVYRALAHNSGDRSYGKALFTIQGNPS